LLSAGHQVRLIESREEEIARLQRELSKDTVILGSGTDPIVLESAGIRLADVVAAVTGADENNLVVTSLARFEFEVPRTIARVNNPKNAWMFTNEMGVDAALNQADLMGHLIAEEMSLGDMVTLLKLRKGQYSLIEEKVDPEAMAAGKAIRDLPIPQRCVFAALIRKGELIIPRGDTVLQPADEILAVVHASNIQDLAELLGRTETLAD
jgi:trk system potassium uptake protein TrkA